MSKEWEARTKRSSRLEDKKFDRKKATGFLKISTLGLGHFVSGTLIRVITIGLVTLLGRDSLGLGQ